MRTTIITTKKLREYKIVVFTFTGIMIAILITFIIGGMFLKQYISLGGPIVFFL